MANDRDDLRRWITICKAQVLSESYTDDTRRAGAVITSADFNLTIGKFAAEQGQLVAAFPIESEEVVSVLRAYTTASSLNAALLADRKLSAKAQIQYDTLMQLKAKHFRLNEEHHVYSGTGLFDPTTISKDDVFQTAAFLSASLNIEVAAKTNNFRRRDQYEDHLLHFILPKGYDGCFYLGPYSTSPEELEMIIFPNEKFMLISSRSRQIGKIARHMYTLKPAGYE